MKNAKHRKSLIKAVAILDKTYQSTLTNAIEILLFSGEKDEISKMLNSGIDVPLDESFIAQSDNPNVKIFREIIEELRQAYNDMKFANHVTLKEIHENE